MSDKKARLVRREARRILGDRSTSVVGELRDRVVAHDEMLSTIHRGQRTHEERVANHIEGVKGVIGTVARDMSAEIQEIRNIGRSHVGRLETVEFVQNELRKSWWTRVRWFWTGSVTR